MNLSTLPQWFWIGAAVLAFLWARKNGHLDKLLQPAPIQTGSPRPVMMVAAATAEPTASGLTEVRRVSFEFDVAVTPVSRPPASSG